MVKEKGVVRKRWKDRVPVCCVYPNTYYIGMSNLAFHIIYRTLNDLENFVCERAFLSEKVLSLETGHTLKSFDILFFTLSFEIDYLNVVRILVQSGIPVFSKKRKTKPLVVAGGICVMMNPEPLHEIFDLFILGDIESTLREFTEKYEEIREKDRQEIIDKLSGLEYVYNPERLEVKYSEDGLIDHFVPPDYKVQIKRYKGKKLGVSAIIAADTEFSSMFLLEGTRGCPSRCPFCLTGNLYHFTFEAKLPDFSTSDDIGIIGGGVSYHPKLLHMVKELKKNKKRVHLPSLRLDEVELEIIELLKDDIKTLTFGIEAGSERLRRFLGKPMPDHHILEKLRHIFSIKPFNLKLYFMIGVYGEKKEDVESIIEITKKIRHVMLKECAKKGKIGMITVHANPFIPKPSTPFQWLAMEEPESLKEKLSKLKKSIGKIENVYFTHESVKYSFIQGLFSKGDRKISKIVINLAMGKTMKEILREFPINLDFYVTRIRKEDEIFPWDFIKGREKKSLLIKLKKALTFL